MRKMFLAVMACVASMGSGAAQALPNAPFLATAEMVATVRSVSISGSLVDRDGNYVRDLTMADTTALPWNVGDRLTVRWEQHSADLQDCRPNDTHFAFGGLTHGTSGGFSGSCYSTDPAAFVQLERAAGGTSPVWDSWETAIARGPGFNMETGEVVPYLDVVDGLVTDCCVYLYDPDADEVITVNSNGSQSPGLPSWPVQFLWFTTFEGDSGGGGMNLYSSQMLGIYEWEDPETGELITLGSLADGYFGVTFDVEWRSTFQTEQQVPEPAALALAGAGLMGAAVIGRRSRKRRGL